SGGTDATGQRGEHARNVVAGRENAAPGGSSESSLTRRRRRTEMSRDPELRRAADFAYTRRDGLHGLHDLLREIVELRLHLADGGLDPLAQLVAQRCGLADGGVDRGADLRLGLLGRGANLCLGLVASGAGGL